MQLSTHGLQRLTVKELQNMALELKVENPSGVRKQDLIIAILEKQTKSNAAVYGEGVLEVMPDGYGFYVLQIIVIYQGQMIFMFLILKLKDLD